MMETTYRTSVTLAAPTSEPISLDEAKKHLEIASADATHDKHVSRLITAVRELWEEDTQSVTIQRTATESLPEFPDECWRFYHRPVASITSIAYYDASNVSQTLSTDVYELDAPNRRLRLKVDQYYPIHETRWDAITITYLAGETNVNEMAKACMLLKLDLLFELRGMTKDKNSVSRAYEHLIERYLRTNYP